MSITPKARTDERAAMFNPARVQSSYEPRADRYLDQLSTKSLRQELKKQVLRGGAAAVAGEIASAGLRIVSIALLARLLRPEDFGLLAMVSAITVFIERFKDFGLSDATVQARELTHSQISNLFWLNAVICLGLSLVVALLSGVLVWFYAEPRLMAISLTLSPTLIFSGLVIQHRALLRRQLRFGVLAWIQLSSLLASTILAILLAFSGFGYWALVAREFSGAVFVMIGTWYACPWRPAGPRRGVKWGHLISFGKYIAAFNIVHFFSRSMDKVLIGRLFGPTWLGLYTHSHRMMSLPISQIQVPVFSVAFPALSAVQNETALFQKSYAKFLSFLLFFSMPITVFAAVFSDVLVTLLLGQQWITAIPIFRAFALSSFIDPAVGTVGFTMVAVGRTKEYFRLGLGNALVFLFCVGLGSVWGALGVAVGFSAAAYVAVLTCTIYGLRWTPVSRWSFWRGVLEPGVCSLGMGLVLGLLRHAAGWPSTLVSCLLFGLGGALLYLGLWLLLPRGREIVKLNFQTLGKLVPSISSRG